MRQAGRYLPEYRAVRDRYDFLTLCRTPELAAKVTLQPLTAIGVDAAIIFSDIMVIPEAMGMGLQMVESKGPVLDSPIRSTSQIDALAIPDPSEKLDYVMEAIRLTRKELGNKSPIIGFAGAPWTLFSYMVQGQGSKDFRHPKTMVYQDPALAHRMLEKITLAVGDYLAAQIEAGADAVQIFDTWGGLLPPQNLEEFSLGYIARIIERLSTLDAPIIVFAKDCGYALTEISRTRCDVVSIDWKVNIGSARQEIGAAVALQGNLDPVVLYTSPERVAQEASLILKQYGMGEGHIFNLGHGILPDVPVENVKALVRAVGEQSPRYHTRES
jgi:uroporphyrinogen decarboxylase